MKRVPEKERDRIAQMLREGVSQRRVAKRFHRSPRVVNLIARDRGIESPFAHPIHATLAHMRISEDRKYRKLTKQLEKVTNPEELLQLAKDI